jgi:hypothetical protein
MNSELRTPNSGCTRGTWFGLGKKETVFPGREWEFLKLFVFSFEIRTELTTFVVKKGGGGQKLHFSRVQLNFELAVQGMSR